MTEINQKEYLKKYLGIGKAPGEKKKKKKDKIKQKRVKIIDDDTEANIEIIPDDDPLNEDAPQIVAIIDERPPSLRVDEKTNSHLWKPIGSVASSNTEQSVQKLLKSSFKIGNKQDKNNQEDTSKQRNEDIDISSSGKRRYDKDNSPPRRRNNDDISPPRKRLQDDNSPPHKRNDRDSSPPRRRRDASDDSSPPRKRPQNNDNSPPRKKNNSDSSPSRKRKSIDSSPQRKRKYHDQDNSPPRRRRNDGDNNISSSKRKTDNNSLQYRRRKDDHDNSSPRRNKTQKNDRDQRDHTTTPPRRIKTEKDDESNKMKTTLDGRQAGLQNAQQLMDENHKFRERENELFQTISTEQSGVNAVPIIRDRKTGKIRNIEQEQEQKRKKQEKEEKQKEKYSRWGRGLKQVENYEEKLQNDLHEMSKPLARYADDEDLERHLKEQEREGDPMLNYLRQKKRKEAKEKGIVEKPKFEGEFLPNRYSVRPGHRWDGVDRSNGYEKRWFEVQNAKRIQLEDSYKWSTEDM